MELRIEHANLAVKDVDQAIRFLKTAFPAFEVRGEGKTADGSRWLHVGTAQTYIALEHATDEAAAVRIPYSPRPGLNHLGCEVDDVEALRLRLLQAGYSESTVPNAHPHRTRIYFHDHDGNDWEFVQYHTDDPALRNDYVIPDL